MPRPQRILYLSDLLRADSSTLRTFELARALTARGFEVTTVVSGGAMVEKFRKAGLPLRYYYKIDRLALPFAFNAKIISLARGIEPAIIHARSPRLSRLAARLARACRVKYVVTVNSIAESRYKIKRTRRCAGVVAASQCIREWLVNNKSIPKEVITVIPNGVEVDPFRRKIPDEQSEMHGRPAAHSSGVESPGTESAPPVPVVGMVGTTFAAGEGHDCFLDAASHIAAGKPDTHFVIAGDGHDRHIRAKLEKLGLVKHTTIIPGFLDFRRLLRSIDVLLVPCATEGRSRLILDAMACRRAVVATGVGENYEVISDGENGLLVQKNDSEAFAAKTIELLSNDALRSRILDSALDTVCKKFSLARMAKNTIAFYAKAMQ